MLLALLALRAGLALRRARRLGTEISSEQVQGHLRWAKLAVVLVGLAFIGGPSSMKWLRGHEIFTTLHSYLGLCTVILFGVAGFLGHRLEQGDFSPLEHHARLAVLAVLLGMITAVAGFVLLP